MHEKLLKNCQMQKFAIIIFDRIDVTHDSSGQISTSGQKHCNKLFCRTRAYTFSPNCEVSCMLFRYEAIVDSFGINGDDIL